jgi:hypothetical protein
VPASGSFELAIERGRRPEWRCAMSDAHLVGCAVTADRCDTRATEGPLFFTNAGPWRPRAGLAGAPRRSGRETPARGAAPRFCEVRGGH